MIALSILYVLGVIVFGSLCYRMGDDLNFSENFGQGSTVIVSVVLGLLWPAVVPVMIMVEIGSRLGRLLSRRERR